MYLRQMQLDLPYIIKPEIIKKVMEQYNCTYEEAIEIDYDKNWMIEVRRKFDLETRCMVDMFLRLLGKFKTKNCSKILIDCVEKSPEIECPCYKGSVEGIGLVEYELDYKDFFAKDNYEKKKIVIKIIKECLYAIVEEQQLDLSNLDSVFNKIEELEYTNFWVLGKKVKSPNKLYTAELYIEHNIESIDFFAVVRNKQDEIVEKKLIVTELPSRWMYNQYLGKLAWASDTEINLNDKTGFTLFTVSL